MRSDTAGRVQAEVQEPSRGQELPLEAQEGLWVKPLGAERGHGAGTVRTTASCGTSVTLLAPRDRDSWSERQGWAGQAWGRRGPSQTRCLGVPSLQSSEFWLLPVPAAPSCPSPSQLPAVLSFWAL